jgi:molecular chaperone DnaK (HSP70)
MYAKMGDLHYLTTKFDVSMSEAHRILAAFKIANMEEARAVVRNGIIAELDDAQQEERLTDEANRVSDRQEAEDRLQAHEEKIAPETKTVAEIDAALNVRREEAQRQNKADKLRQLIAEGIDPETNTSGFRIPLRDVSKFKRMVVHGVSHLKRHFGGTEADIVEEIKRLVPEMDIDMLRP